MGPPSVKKAAQKYTWDDYLTLSDDERGEIIDGVANNMTHVPQVNHQTSAGNLFSQPNRKLANKPCKPLIVPADVIISQYDIVQLAVFVVCDKNKINEANVKGVPDLAVEIFSPATASKDMREKKNF